MIMKNRSKDNIIKAWERIGIGQGYQLDGTLKSSYFYTGGGNLSLGEYFQVYKQHQLSLRIGLYTYKNFRWS